MLMGYFNSIADAAFKENPEGEGWLYYPNGIISKGRIVPDVETRIKLHNFQKRLYMFGISLGVLYGLFIDIKNLDIYSFVIPSISIALVLWRQHFLVKDLSVSAVKLGYKESVSTAIKGLPSWYIYLLYTSSLFILASGLYFHFTKSENSIGVIFVGSSLVCLILGLVVQKVKKT